MRQSDTEVEVSVLLPPGTKAKDVLPEILPIDVSPGNDVRDWCQTIVVHRAPSSSRPLKKEAGL